jgi:serine O-acetyltransferase
VSPVAHQVEIMTVACRDLLRSEIASRLRRLGAHAMILDRRTREAVAGLAAEDLMTFAARDPAAQGSWELIWDSYVAYQAVLSYRIAHALSTAPADESLRTALARQVSEQAKIETRIEIHPSARIGRRFVIDHGVGTIIGETAVIGNDGYILQGAILGATGIAGNRSGRRHPHLGDRVQVGGYARILGPISVGDDVMIGPCAVVTQDVPAGARISVITQYQTHAPYSRIKVFGVVPSDRECIDIHGLGLGAATADLVDDLHRPSTTHSLVLLAREDRLLRCRVVGSPREESLRLTDAAGICTVVGRLQHVWQELDSVGSRRPVALSPSTGGH